MNEISQKCLLCKGVTMAGPARAVTSVPSCPAVSTATAELTLTPVSAGQDGPASYAQLQFASEKEYCLRPILNKNLYNSSLLKLIFVRVQTN